MPLVTVESVNEVLAQKPPVRGKGYLDLVDALYDLSPAEFRSFDLDYVYWMPRGLAVNIGRLGPYAGPRMFVFDVPDMGTWGIVRAPIVPAEVIARGAVPYHRAAAAFVIDACQDLGIPVELDCEKLPGKAAVLFRNPRGIWQLSYFERGFGPIGHDEGHDPVKLVRDAMQSFGCTRLTPGIIDEIVNTIEVPVANPQRKIRARETWVENPAWVNRALARNFENLKSEIPPEWLPALSDVRAGRGGAVTVDFHELGCGGYGCVLETHTPDVVLKLTTDASEAEFVEMAAPWGWPEGITRYYGQEALAGRAKITRRFPPQEVTALWRESARLIGKFEETDEDLDVDRALGGRREREKGGLLLRAIYDTSSFVHAVLMQMEEDATELYGRMREVRAQAADIVRASPPPVVAGFRKELRDRLVEAGHARYERHGRQDRFIPNAAGLPLVLATHLEGYRATAEMMRINPVVRAIGETLLFYLERQVILADLHGDNVGVVDRETGPIWAITDPGNVLVLPEPW